MLQLLTAEFHFLLLLQVKRVYYTYLVQRQTSLSVTLRYVWRPMCFSRAALDFKLA